VTDILEFRARRPAAANGSKAGRIALNDGHSIPQIGLGVWQIDDEKAPEIINAAIDTGYRLIDTAKNYGNEAGVGRALARASAPRDQLFVTTKLWNDSQGYDQTLRAFDISARKLGVEVIDLYLIHWPCPQRKAYVDTWRALIELRKQGRVASIGVSNFAAEHLEHIIGETGVVPAVNQIELHPGFQQRALQEVHELYGIVTEAWSPLGHGSSLADPVLHAIARRHGCTPAQVVLRWHVENGFVAIPKSKTLARITENIAIFGFELSKEDRVAIAALDKVDGRIGPDPLAFGRERFLRRLIGRSWM
jgi:2,5-diketo-D-gluconate reductase A